MEQLFDKNHEFIAQSLTIGHKPNNISIYSVALILHSIVIHKKGFKVVNEPDVHSHPYRFGP
jgi:hypothetical protein